MNEKEAKLYVKIKKSKELKADLERRVFRIKKENRKIQELIKKLDKKGLYMVIQDFVFDIIIKDRHDPRILDVDEREVAIIKFRIEEAYKKRMEQTDEEFKAVKTICDGISDFQLIKFIYGGEQNNGRIK